MERKGRLSGRSDQNNFSGIWDDGTAPPESTWGQVGGMQRKETLESVRMGDELVTVLGTPEF